MEESTPGISVTFVKCVNDNGSTKESRRQLNKYVLALLNAERVRQIGIRDSLTVN